MGWEKVKPINTRNTRKIGGCSISICAKAKETQPKGKAAHNSRVRLNADTLDRLRLKVNDRFSWLIDHARKAIAIELDASGNCTLHRDTKLSNDSFRIHIPRDVAGFIRDNWKLGLGEHGESVAVELILSSGVIEIRRTTNEQT